MGAMKDRFEELKKEINPDNKQTGNIAELITLCEKAITFRGHIEDGKELLICVDHMVGLDNQVLLDGRNPCSICGLIGDLEIEHRDNILTVNQDKESEIKALKRAHKAEIKYLQERLKTAEGMLEMWKKERHDGPENDNERTDKRL